MTANPSSISVPLERLTGLRDAIARALEGGFDEAAQRLADGGWDLFGEIERYVRDLIGDFRLAIEQNEVSIEEFMASKRELLEKIETIERQRAEIQQLSAPVIDVWDRIVTVPLTGVLDPTGAQELTERLLARVQAARTSWVILDLTGATRVDEHLASHLVRLSDAVRLMGAQCLVTGMRPDVAEMIVSLGVETAGLRTVATLKEGLRLCLSRAGGR